MKADEFWQIIADVNEQSAGDMDTKVDLLTKHLQPLDAEQVLAFSRIFDSMMDKAYTYDLWGAAYVIQGGCSDDGFMDFRSSLISTGKEVFERAASSPETLAELARDMVECLFLEGFAYPATTVYEQKTGSLPEREAPHPADPTGEPWDEDQTVLERRFPKLWAKYGQSPAGLGKPRPEPGKPWWKFW